MPGLHPRDQRTCGTAGEFLLGPRAVKDRQRPVIAQARLVVAQVARARPRLLKSRKPIRDPIIQRLWRTERRQHRAASELLRDRADRQPALPRHRPPGLEIGIAPGARHYDAAFVNHTRKPPRTAEARGKSVEKGFGGGKVQIGHRGLLFGAQATPMHGRAKAAVCLRVRVVPCKLRR